MYKEKETVKGARLEDNITQELLTNEHKVHIPSIISLMIDDDLISLAIIICVVPFFKCFISIKHKSASMKTF